MQPLRRRRRFHLILPATQSSLRYQSDGVSKLLEEMSHPMPEKEPQVTFTDRRKISSDGEIRPEALAEQEENRRQQEQREAAARAAQPPAAAPESAGRNEPSREEPRAAEQSRTDAATQEEDMPEGPTAQESAESHAAYQQTTAQLDD